MKWSIGCSGFHYKEWKEVFYPKGLPPTKWFELYSRRFQTVELNVTFYRFPRVPFLENWYRKSPAKFLFAVKVPRLITHFKKFSEAGDLLTDFYSACHIGLKEKLGPILFQLPPDMVFTDENLQAIIKSLDYSFLNVVECRHITWWDKKVFAAFKKYKICFCSISYPGLPDDVITTTKNVYYRFHGIPKLYYSSYEKAFLEKVTEVIKASGASKAFVYFNNTASSGAIENAEYMKKYIGRKKS
jgi:uncharacterized protein YecE (DUF72 family)